MSTIEKNFELLDGIIEWIQMQNIGVSSNTILFAITGISVYGNSRCTPIDKYDFRRCYELIKCVPMLKDHLHLVKTKYPEWEGIIDNWDDLVHDFHTNSNFYEKLKLLRS